MASNRKLSAFRQLSLHCESPTPEQRRKPLKKQFSEDIPDSKSVWTDSNVGIKICLSAKSRKTLDYPKPPKIAWGEEDTKINDTVIVRKCSELYKPLPNTKITRQNSLDKESILSAKEDISDKLRKILKDEKETTKRNINIFLAHNPKTNEEDISYPDNGTNLLEQKEHGNKISPPKVIQPLFIPNKDLFQFRRSPKSKINLNEPSYCPSRFNEHPTRRATIDRSNTILVTPLIEKQDPKPETKTEETSISCDYVTDVSNEAAEEPQPIRNVIIRPVTAAAKREMFKRRTNSAFNSFSKESTNSSKPPLLRSSSAPSKPEHKSKFLASKRKMRSAKAREFKAFHKDNDGSCEIENKTSYRNKKGLDRLIPSNTGDIVTMVSLVSPATSDTEEVPEVSKEKVKNKRNTSPDKIVCSKKEESVQKISSLRKTVKSVSFQQSSIHAIRNFSASFPARRSSMVTALMLGNSGPLKRTTAPQKIQEKRATNSFISDDERMPKRRLLRNVSAGEPSSVDESESIDCSLTSTSQVEEPSNMSIDINEKTPNITVNMVEEARDIEKQKVVSKEAKDDERKTDEEEENDIQFSNPKEKECWSMYCKMTDKGVKVTYDTILRGLLTPTEYRNRRHSLATLPPTVDNTPI